MKNGRINTLETETMTWLTTKEAAEYLKISRATLMDLKSSGKVKAFPLFKGKKMARPILRFREEDLDVLLFGKRYHRKRQGERETETS